MSAPPIDVVADWHGLGGARLMGTLHARVAPRGEEIFSFEYDAEWLKSASRQVLDPNLRFYRGPQYSNAGNFGLFLDSSPDRWGRVLMQRREALLAREDGRAERRLHESDYLLGVHDAQRLGALRFRVDGVYLDDNDEKAAPPLASLRELEHASLELEKTGAVDDPAYSRWLAMLIAPGSSLGGARPKASVVDPDGHLWIAKFPSRGDDFDVAAWEFVTRELASECGIEVPRARLRKFGSKHHTYLSRRFDRHGEGSRLHFSSAMTMIGRREGDDLGPASYLDLAEFLMQHGADTTRDLEQLWLRILFNVHVSNTDDHLRNHGFMLNEKGWNLAPAYDMNPNRFGGGLSLNISETSNAQSLEVVWSIAEYFRVSPKRVAELTEHVSSVVAKWRDLAAQNGIARDEIERMAPAFRFV